MGDWTFLVLLPPSRLYITANTFLICSVRTSTLISWKQCSPKPCSPGRLLPVPVDRLSSLPDDILLLILSFLTLKEVVKTSLLSRRWMNLWMHTPVLNFHASVSNTIVNDKESQDYVKWVNHVLRRHKGNSLKEFKIVCDLDYRHFEDIDKWLEFALSRKVKRLELNLMFLGCRVNDVHVANYVFPDEFLYFGCWKADSHGGAGRVLKFDLKCLKSLSLKNVDVTDEAINSFLQNCPFLERLEVVGVDELASLVISGPNLVLRYLQIKWCDALDVISISNFNLVSLEIPSVEVLTVTDLPILVDLCISKTPFNTSQPLSLASCCHSQLEVLTLQGLELKDLTQLSNLDQLTKLRRLVIKVEAWGDESLTMLISIINSCPRLEEFVLMLLWCDPKRTERTMIEVVRSSPYLENRTLKVFEFLGYYGRVSDAELVIHVVESAICLEKIIIDPRCPQRLEKPCYSETTREQKARRYALKQYKGPKNSYSIQPHIHLVIR